MRTERDRAMSLADVFVGPRCKGVGRSGPSIVFASKPTPGVWVPSLRFSFRDHLSFVGWRKYRTRCDCQFAPHISLHTSPFQLVFEPSKCPGPVHRQRLAFGQRRLAFGQRRRRNRRIRRRMFEGGRREGASSKEEESSKEPV